MLINKITEVIGNTPLLRLNNLEKEVGAKAKIFAKLEAFNPGSSVKDRAALSMIEDAEEKGLLKSGGTIIEPTSGNTGIAISLLCASKGYKAIIVMPESMSIERRKLIQAYGAELVLTDPALGMQGSLDKAEELKNQIEGSIILGQFDNPANPLAHYKNTGREIVSDLDGKVDVLVAGFGTGGTVSGCGKYFREQGLNTRIVAVEPENSPLVTKGNFGKHKIQGLGANFVPKNLDLDYVDEIKLAGDEAAIESSRLLSRKEGFFVGISSGAALSKAIELSKLDEYKDKNIVVVLPDTGERYLSTDLVQ